MKSYYWILSIPLILLSFLSQSQNLKQDSENISVMHLSSFVDSLMIKKMEEYKIPGAAVILVDRRHILLSHGYGYADIGNKIPVDPNRTLFRIASVSKLVVGTAVMQCVEKGLLDLHADINLYLKDFKIKNTFPKPVTLADLLTHSAGFDEFVTGKSARKEKDVEPLGKFLKKNLTQRIEPPGEISTYSNLGIALAAHLVEIVTGQDFADYCREHIFLPLGMQNTGFRLDEKMRSNLSRGYLEENGIFIEFPFDYLREYPTGQMVTSVNAFSKFMICHLNEGKFGDVALLQPGTVLDMHHVHFTHNPVQPSGWGWTFVIDTLNDQPYLYHGGGYAGTSTMLFLFPEMGFGIFIAANSLPSKGSFVISVANEIAGKIIPPLPPDTTRYPLTNLPSYDRNVDKFTGIYRFTRYPKGGLTRTGILLGIQGAELPIWKNNEGMLMMNYMKDKTRRLIQVKPLVFRSIDDRYYLTFRQDEKGNITHLFTDGTTAFERVPRFMAVDKQRALFVFCLIFLIVFSILPIFTWRKKMKENRVIRAMHKISGLAASTFLLYYVAWGVLITRFFSKTEIRFGFAYGVPTCAYLFQVIPFLGIVLFSWYLFYFFRSIRQKGIPLVFQVYHCFYFIVISLHIWFIWYWKILGFRF